MATVSARIDDNVKESAEKIAESIGMPLSSVINVFLKKFVSVNGFPFAVVVEETNPLVDYINTKATKAFEEVIRNPDIGKMPPVTYLDPETGELVTVPRKKK